MHRGDGHEPLLTTGDSGGDDDDGEYDGDGKCDSDGDGDERVSTERGVEVCVCGCGCIFFFANGKAISTVFFRVCGIWRIPILPHP